MSRNHKIVGFGCNKIKHNNGHLLMIPKNFFGQFHGAFCGLFEILGKFLEDFYRKVLGIFHGL
jgi:hypothetical protein